MSTRTESLTALNVLIAQLTRPSLVLVYSLVGAGVAIFLHSGVMRRALYLPAVVLVANLASSVLKRVIGRERPPLDVHLLYETNPAMPSGHATGAAAAAVALTVLAVTATRHRGRWAVVVASWLLALASSWGRLYLGVHWPTDVVAGWVLGAGVAVLGAVVVRQTRTYSNI